MKKKILSCLLVVAFILPLFSGLDITTVTAKATDILRWESYEYVINDDNTVTLTCYKGKSKQISVPSSINGMPVVKINDYCFSGDVAMNSSFSGTVRHPNRWYNKRIEKVVVPPSVKTIGKGAFQSAEQLRRVVLYDGLEIIEEYAFYKCPQLKDIELPDTLKDFTLYAFELTGVEKLVLGSNISEPEIRDSEGTKVREITLNAESVSLGNVEISNNSSLEEIVCSGTFLGLDSVKGPLKRIVCNGDVSYSVISDMVSKGFCFSYGKDRTQRVFSTTPVNGEKTYESNGYIYRVNEKAEAVITQYVGDEVDVIIPSSLGGLTVTELAAESFWKENLVSVIIPDTIETIGERAFAYNTFLESVTFSPKITSIPAECFMECKSLKTLSLHENLTAIEKSAFRKCESLGNVAFPEKLNILSEFAFYGCNSITSLTFPESLKKIGPGAFKDCESLKSVDMPYIEEIGSDAFYTCHKLEKINFSKKLRIIGSGAFERCNLSGTLDLSSVEKIGADAFCFCDIKKVILNDNLVRLEYGTFQSCLSLEEINLPSQLEYIGDCCFRSTKVCKAVFGNKLKEIGAMAFEGCKELYIMELPDSIEKIGNFAFQGTLLELLIIPENLAVIGYGAFGNCKELETIYFNAMNCTIEPYIDNNTEIDFGNLKDTSPFYGCDIKEIFIGVGITSIGGSSGAYGTFESCESLEKIIIPDTVSEIGKASFKNCYALQLAVISDSVTSVADDAFDGCNNLTILCFEDSYIYEYAQNNGIAVSTFLVSPIPNQTYTGKKITPEVTVTFSGNTLHKYIDFGVTFANNINVGEADVTVKGKGDYKNFSNKTRFTIVTKDISSATISAIADQAWTGDVVTPELIVTDSSGMLYKDKDYTVSYSDNKKEGTATVVVTGKGNYSGSSSANFSIVKMTDTENFFIRLGASIKAFFIRVGAFFAKIFGK